MSNHFTGLSLGPPQGDPRLDLTDLFAFQAPADRTRTVLILNCNTFAQAADFQPDAVYRIMVKAAAVGDVRFRARLASDSLSEPVIGEEGTKVYSDAK